MADQTDQTDQRRHDEGAAQHGPDEHPHQPGQPPVGSVAEEAARLLDALGGWVSTSGYAAGPAREEAPDPAVPDTEAPPDETRTQDAQRCGHCGAANEGERPVTCQWCPVCQGIGLLRSVRPETVDRLADLAGALATALRDVATHTRGTAGSPQPPHDPGTRGPRVQDITIDDDQGDPAP